MLENKTNLFKKEARRKKVSWFGCTITLLVSNRAVVPYLLVFSRLCVFGKQ